MKSSVVALKSATYHKENIKSHLSNGFSLLGGIYNFISRGDKVLLKPNLLMPKAPEFNVTSHPSVMEAVAELVGEAGGIPSIGDGPGGTGYELHHVYEITGMKGVADKLGIELVNFRQEGSRRIDLDGQEVFITKALERFDKVISISKLKTHNLTTFTGAVKNTYGLIPGYQKAGYHKKYPFPEEFCELVVRVYKATKPTLNIMDAIEGMDGNGPGAGRTRQIGALLMSEDGVALDKVAVELVGGGEVKIPTLKIAERMGLGNTELENIEILGANLHEFDVKDFKFPKSPQYSWAPRGLANFITRFMWVRPYLLREKCISCETCFKSCPVDAIKMVNNFPVFDYKKCISCLCCFEVCPEAALDLKRSLIARIIT
ncbi:DUF362 domain-containing protein [bacterium]|nr:DUF362 domain-containing protein [bacterium]